MKLFAGAFLALAATAQAASPKAIMGDILEMFHGVSTAADIFTADAVWIDNVNARGAKTEGIPAIQAMADMYSTMMADIHFDTDTTIAGPVVDGTFVATWEGSGTHTGEVMGMAPLGTGKQTYRGVNKVSVNADGLVTKVQVLHGDFLLEKTGYLNKMVVDTTAMANAFIGWWNHEDIPLETMISNDFTFEDGVNMKGMFPEAKIQGYEALTALRLMYKTAFSDMTFTDVTATPLDGDKFILCWTFSGTHDGPMGAIPATGTKIPSHEGCNVMTVEAGAMTSCQVNHAQSLLAAIGVLPTPGAAAKEEL